MKLNKIFNESKCKLSVFFVSLLVIQFIATCYMNFTRSEYFLDFDSALAFRHGIEMWKNKSIFFNNFIYVSSLEIDCASFFAAPIYLRTGNISLSFGLVHIIFGAFTIFIIMDIFKTLKTKLWCGAVATLFVMTPYFFGQLDYFNMLFISVGQYQFRLITVLLLINLMLKSDYSSLKSKILILICLMFLCLTSISSGNYVFLMGLFPIALSKGVDVIKNQKLTSEKHSLIFLILCIIVSIVALIIRHHYVGDTGRSSLNLVVAQDLHSNISSCIIGIYMLIGAAMYQTEIPIMSVEGILRIFKFIFVSILIFANPIIATKHKMYEKSNLFQISFTMALLNLFVLMITSTTYGSPVFEYRYHILWIIPIMISCALCLYYFIGICKNKYLNFVIISFFVAFICLSNIKGYEKIKMVSKRNYEYSSKILEVAEKYKVQTILTYKEATVAHVMRTLDVERIIFALTEDFTPIVMDYYYDLWNKSNLGNRNILVLNIDEFSNLPKNIKNEYALVEQFNEMQVYYTEENPFGSE